MGQTGLSLVVMGLVLAFCEVHAGGYKDFLCGADSDKLFFPCATDCQNNHGSTGGTCGHLVDEDYNCYCHHKRAPVANPTSLHCLAEVRPAYANAVCEIDCACNHGAVGGDCDFGMKACICHGSRLNKENENCLADSVPRFAELMETLLGADALGESGMAFIEGAKKFEATNSSENDSSYTY